MFAVYGGSVNFGPSNNFLDQTVSCAITVSQGGWGNSKYLASPFFGTKFSSGLLIGVSGQSETFTNVQAIVNFLPQGGTSAVLPTGNNTNPTTALKNTLAGQTVALTLNKALNVAAFGSASVQTGPYAGQTVDAVLTLANQALGNMGSPSKTTLSNLTSTLSSINSSFENAVPSGYLSCPSGN